MAYPAVAAPYNLQANCARLGIPVPLISKVFLENINTGVDRTLGQSGLRSDIGVAILAASAAPIVATPNPCLSLNSSVVTTNRASFTPLQAFTGNMTCFCIVKPQKKILSGNVTFVGTGSSTVAGWFLGGNNSVTTTDYYPRFAVVQGGALTNAANSANVYNVGDRLVLCGVRDGTALRLYQDGAQSALATCTDAAIDNVGSNIQIGGFTDVGTFNTQGDYETIVIWNAALPPNVVAAISADPYGQLWDWVPDNPVSSNVAAAMAGAGFFFAT